jgi:ZIP family zinc transporter
MTTPVDTVLLYALPGVGALVLGGTVAAFWKPGPTLRSCIQHFAAGVVFAVVAVELLPDIRRGTSLWWVGVGFALGVVGMLALRRFSGEGKREHQEGGDWPWGLLGAVGVDVFNDGLLLGIGFAVGAKQGILLAFALAAEFLSLGLATSATLGQSADAARWKSIGTTCGLALPFVGGATLGATLVQGLTGNPLAGVLSFACAALLYLVTEELLVEAHEVKETSVAASMFFAGFLLFLILGMLE